MTDKLNWAFGSPFCNVLFKSHSFDMSHASLLDYALSAEFVKLRDTPQFVVERRRIIECQIDGDASKGLGGRQLVDLQNELDGMRLINSDSLVQIEYILSLLEERVAQLERIAKELQEDV